MLSLLGRSTLVWAGILALAVANGAFRQGVLIPRLGEATGHVISTVMLSSAVLVVALLTIRWIGPAAAGEAWGVGACWLTLTLAFEFLAGHYLFGTPWPTLLADYNILKGRIWPLVLVMTVLAPVISLGLRK